VAEITPHNLNKNPWVSTAVYKGYENGLNNKQITSLQKMTKHTEKKVS